MSVFVSGEGGFEGVGVLGESKYLLLSAFCVIIYSFFFKLQKC